MWRKCHKNEATVRTRARTRCDRGATIGRMVTTIDIIYDMAATRAMRPTWQSRGPFPGHSPLDQIRPGWSGQCEYRYLDQPQ